MNQWMEEAQEHLNDRAKMREWLARANVIWAGPGQLTWKDYDRANGQTPEQYLQDYVTEHDDWPDDPYWDEDLYEDDPECCQYCGLRECRCWDQD